MGASNSNNTNNNQNNILGTRDPTLSNFVQGVINSNHELGFLPFRLDSRSGARITNKAYMKKAKTQTLLFDIDDNSFTLTQSNKDKNVYSLNFKLSCLAETTVEVYFKATEHRDEAPEVNSVMGIVSEVEAQKFYFAKGVDQSLPLGQCLVNKKLFSYGEPSGYEINGSYSPVLIKINEKKRSSGRMTFARDEQLVYIYLSIIEEKPHFAHHHPHDHEHNHEGCSGHEESKLKLKMEKKGVEINGRFFWTKNIYENKQDISSASSGSSTLCTICYEREVDTLMIPCRHMVLCQYCAKELKNRFQKCPICRLAVTGFIKLSKEERKTYYQSLRREATQIKGGNGMILDRLGSLEDSGEADIEGQKEKQAEAQGLGSEG